MDKVFRRVGETRPPSQPDTREFRLWDRGSRDVNTRVGSRVSTRPGSSTHLFTYSRRKETTRLVADDVAPSARVDGQEGLAGRGHLGAPTEGVQDDKADAEPVVVSSETVTADLNDGAVHPRGEGELGRGRIP